jgi:hypothetical protein
MGPDKVSSCPTLIHARPLSRKLLKSSPMIPDPLTCFPPTANQHYARAARNTAKMAITFHVAASASASSVVARNRRSNSQAPSLESAKQRSVAMRMRGGACRAKLRPTSGVDCQGALKPTRAPCCGTSTRAAARASHPPQHFRTPVPHPSHHHMGTTARPEFLLAISALTAFLFGALQRSSWFLCLIVDRAYWPTGWPRSMWPFAQHPLNARAR